MAQENKQKNLFAALPTREPTEEEIRLAELMESQKKMMEGKPDEEAEKEAAEIVENRRDRLVQALRAAEAEELAGIDSLTELANRRKFDERMESEYSRANRSESDSSIIIIDIDHFKELNDELGHGTGDQALKILSKTIRETFHRESDFPARIGGDEFAVLLPATDVYQGGKLAETLRRAANEAFKNLNEKLTTGQISLSVGISSFKGKKDGFPKTQDGQTVTKEFFLERGDQALYVAKNTKNAIYLDDITQPIPNVKEVIREITEAASAQDIDAGALRARFATTGA